MLSRTADNLYWLARYVERAEYLARILEVTQRLTTLPLAYVGSSNEWESAVATAGCTHAFSATYREANEETVTDFLCFSAANPSSIRNCFEIARTNALRHEPGLERLFIDAGMHDLERHGRLGQQTPAALALRGKEQTRPAHAGRDAPRPLVRLLSRS